MPGHIRSDSEKSTQIADHRLTSVKYCHRLGREINRTIKLHHITAEVALDLLSAECHVAESVKSQRIHRLRKKLLPVVLSALVSLFVR
jgi:hypothetical protein